MNLFFVGNCRCRQLLNLLNTIYHIARFLKNIGSHFGIMQDFFFQNHQECFFYVFSSQPLLKAETFKLVT